mmetsp:Transcript_927/g.3662  ORF Transcript_927/g.3662 Transcript_927/m.3662 type:complete len:243 (+) Transcript_927:129-857(+)
MVSVDRLRLEVIASLGLDKVLHGLRFPFCCVEFTTTSGVVARRERRDPNEERFAQVDVVVLRSDVVNLIERFFGKVSAQKAPADGRVQHVEFRGPFHRLVHREPQWLISTNHDWFIALLVSERVLDPPVHVEHLRVRLAHQLPVELVQVLGAHVLIVHRLLQFLVTSQSKLGMFTTQYGPLLLLLFVSHIEIFAGTLLVPLAFVLRVLLELQPMEYHGGKVIVEEHRKARVVDVSLFVTMGN